jgi:hypothetical protein
MVSRADLDAALNAWEAARDRAASEHLAWGRVLQSHKALIASIRFGGKTFTEAAREFGALSESDGEPLFAAWDEMDRACTMYQEIAATLGDQ